MTKNPRFVLLVTELTTTVTGPEVAPAGTVVTIWVSLQLLIDVAAAPLKFSVLEPCVVPKFEPVMVTVVPSGPVLGVTPLKMGVVPEMTETLSKVIVAELELLLLL